MHSRSLLFGERSVADGNSAQTHIPIYIPLRSKILRWNLQIAGALSDRGK